MQVQWNSVFLEKRLVVFELTCRCHVPCFQCTWLCPAGRSDSGRSSHRPWSHSRWWHPTECRACTSKKKKRWWGWYSWRLHCFRVKHEKCLQAPHQWDASLPTILFPRLISWMTVFTSKLPNSALDVVVSCTVPDEKSCQEPSRRTERNRRRKMKHTSTAMCIDDQTFLSNIRSHWIPNSLLMGSLDDCIRKQWQTLRFHFLVFTWGGFWLLVGIARHPTIPFDSV